MKNKYSVWISHEEQWDKNDIDPPNMQLEASTPHQAAELFAEQHGGYDEGIAVIVRDDEKNTYFEIELVRAWEIDVFNPTTLDKLCAP